MTKNPPTHEQNLLPHLYENGYEDEINLIDLWLVLMKHRTLIAAVMVMCILAGIMFVLLIPAKYQYSTSVELGTRLNGENNMVVIESPETLLAKIQESYIPLVRQQYFAKHSAVEGVPKIEARIPKGSQIIVLSSKGSEGDGVTHKAMQQSVIDTVKADHNRITDVLRKETEILQSKAMAKLEELKDDATLIQAREKRLEDVSLLLANQAKEVRDDLARAKADRANAIKQTKDESRALTLMMLDSGVQQYRQRLAQIDERLKIKVVDSRDTLVRQLANNHRTQLSQQDTIVKLKIQFDNLRETRALMPPMRSPEATGPGGSLIVMLALVLGLMLGVFTAFFAEFLSNVRSRGLAAQD